MKGKKFQDWGDIEEKELRAIVRLCFGLYQDESFDEVASMTGLSKSTISRLYHGYFTGCVRWMTIDRLCAGCGLKVEVTQKGRVVSLTKPRKAG